MNIVSSNTNESNEVQQLQDKYEAVLALRDAEKDPVKYRLLDHAQQAAFREWLFAMQAATMRSELDSYDSTQKMG